MDDADFEAIVEEYEKEILSPDIDYSEVTVLDLEGDFSGDHIPKDNKVPESPRMGNEADESLGFIPESQEKGKSVFEALYVRTDQNFQTEFVSVQSAALKPRKNVNCQIKQVFSTLEDAIIVSDDDDGDDKNVCNDDVGIKESTVVPHAKRRKKELASPETESVISNPKSQTDIITISSENLRDDTLTSSQCHAGSMNPNISTVVREHDMVSDTHKKTDTVQTSTDNRSDNSSEKDNHSFSDNHLKETVSVSKTESQCQNNLNPETPKIYQTSERSGVSEVVEISDDSDLEIIEESDPNERFATFESVKSLTDWLSNSSSIDEGFKQYARGYLMGLTYKTVKQEEEKQKALSVFKKKD